MTSAFESTPQPDLAFLERAPQRQLAFAPVMITKLRPRWGDCCLLQ
jgi:hypothetical protein